MKIAQAIACGVVILLMAAQQSAAVYLGFTFQKVADTDTYIPGLIDVQFTGFVVPSLDGDNIVFNGWGLDLYNGVFTVIDNQIAVVADSGTTVPGTETDFFLFGSASISGNNVAYHAGGLDFLSGIYTNIPGIGNVGGIKVIADNDTVPPNHEFAFFPNYPKVDGNTVAFLGATVISEFELNTGIYLVTNVGEIDEEIHTVVDSNTPIPGGPSNFTVISSVSLEGNDVAFQAGGNLPGGFGGYNGIFSTVGGLHKVAEIGQTIPNAVNEDYDKFVSFNGPSLSGGHVAFHADNGAGEQGIYTDSGAMGSLRTVANTETVIPIGGPITTFTSFEADVAIDDGNIAFIGNGPDGHQGIYLEYQGELKKVITNFEPLDNKMPTEFYLSGDSLSGNKLVFHAYFNDFTQGIYTVTFDPLDVLAGDYNDDGIVDAADYTIWRNHLGQSITLSNETVTPNLVTIEDYDVWKMNYGLSLGSGSASFAELPVPEPDAAALILIAAACRLHRARKAASLWRRC